MNRVGCPACGRAFDPAELSACPACPINGSCSMVCCPFCGTTTVDPAQSRLARFFLRVSGRRRPAPTPPSGATVADLGVGERAVITSFEEGLANGLRTQLLGYGLTPGSVVEVTQLRPVMVLRCDRSELALEPDLAGGVNVRRLDPAV